MIYAVLICALLINTGISLIDKSSSKKLENNMQVLLFSLYKTVLCAIFALIMLPMGNISINIQGGVISILAGLFHGVSVVLIMTCLKHNDAVYVNLFMSAGIILPSVTGWIIDEKALNPVGMIYMVILVGALALILNVRKAGRFNIKMLMIMFICYGMLMVMQWAFPRYCDSGSKTLFSALMYGISAVILGVTAKIKVKQRQVFCLRLSVLLVSAAVLNLFVNVMLTMLSAKLSASVVFPVVHGLKLVIITLFSSLLWKEKLTFTQITGSLIAVMCICMLSI